MRKVLLTLALVGLLALPVLAQFRQLGMQMDATTLLAMPSVQDEIKLTDDQKKDLKSASDEMQKGMRKAFEDKDFSGIGKLREEHGKAVKKIIDKLSDKQATRLLEIETQQAVKGKNPKIFANEKIQKALGMTSSQKDKVKELLASMDKEFKELDDAAKEDRQKFFSNFKKKQELSSDTYTKITKEIDAKDLEKAQGEKFELKFDKKGGKDKKKKEEKKKEDF